MAWKRFFLSSHNCCEPSAGVASAWGLFYFPWLCDTFSRVGSNMSSKREAESQALIVHKRVKADESTSTALIEVESIVRLVERFWCIVVDRAPANFISSCTYYASYWSWGNICVSSSRPLLTDRVRVKFTRSSLVQLDSLLRLQALIRESVFDWCLSVLFTHQF